jgi:hypothetical protein
VQSAPYSAAVSESPPMMSPGSTPPYPVRRVPSETLMVFSGALLGILVFGGLLAVHAIYLVPVPCGSTFGCPTPTPDVAAYGSTLRGLAWVAIGALDFAAGLSVALAFILGSRSEAPESTRRSVFLFATIFTPVWVVGSFLLLTVLSIVRYT